MSYFILFLSAFAAATLLPLQSEAVLLTLLALDQYSAYVLIGVATLGNVLGSCINWWLGYKFEHYKNKSWFPISEAKLLKAQQTYQRYGFYSLLLSWVPMIGDPITLIAGLLKERFWRFVMIVTLAEGGRYLFVYWLYLGLF